MVDFDNVRKGISPKNEKQCVQESLQKVALTDFEHRQSKGLSGGEKRRLSIAIALVGQPHVVFLDEPTVIIMSNEVQCAYTLSFYYFFSSRLV